MKASKTTPAWALELTQEVCRDYKRALPKRLQWYNRNDWSKSGGTCWRDKIHISAGDDEYDQVLVLLHELAHHIVNKTKPRVGHTIRFWRLAFELYERYGIDLGVALEREEDYRKKATWAYQEALAKKTKS